jgi:dTDP-4-dehydrorhamnose reductase
MEAAPQKTILIFGISSFVGSNIAEFLKRDFRIVGTYHKNRIAIPGVMTIPCNVLVKEEVQRAIFATRPDYTIYCAGLSSITECASRIEPAEALNTNGLFNVAEFCQRYRSQVVYISSNFVFSGEDKRYLEVDIPDANSLYGKTQASAEFYIQKTLLNYLVFRCCRLYGRGAAPSNLTWFESLQNQLALKNTVKFDDYLKVGFLDVYYLALLLKISFEKGVSNRLFQVSSQNLMTFYEFANLYAETFNDSKAFISRAQWKFPYLKGSSVISFNDHMKFELDISNIEGFSRFKMPTIEESIALTHKRLNGQQAKSNSRKRTDGISFI